MVLSYEGGETFFSDISHEYRWALRKRWHPSSIGTFVSRTEGSTIIVMYWHTKRATRIDIYTPVWERPS